jgi:hypothetical protein
MHRWILIALLQQTFKPDRIDMLGEVCFVIIAGID